MRFCLFILLLSLASCFVPKKACLDIEAANFDATADENCCCTYPSLSLNFLHVYDTLVYLEKNAYRNEFGMFRPQSVVFYLQEFKIQQQNTFYPISDSLSFYSFGANPGDTIQQELTNDFVLVRRTTLNAKAGTFRQTGTFEGIQFRVGLTTAANKVMPSKAPANHPLHTQSDNLWTDRNNGFVVARIIVAADSLSATVPDTFIYRVNDLPASFFMQNSSNFKHEPGYDFSLKVKVDYKALFSGVDWSAPISTRKVTMRDNLPKVFKVSQ